MLTKGHDKSKDDTIHILPKAKKSIAMTVDLSGMRHIIDRLTDLYNDPISSTVREIVSNGFDASTIDDKPVEITSPSLFNPVLMVRDYGYGMDMQDVEDIYAKYGASTKREDMGQIGAYGLGAKAPLAYTDNFEVTTYQNGHKIHFSLSRETDGNFIRILDEGNTDEPNGTMVTVPVGLDHIDQFTRAINNYKNYAVKRPIVIDGETFFGAPSYTKIGSMLLDEDSQTYGDVFVLNTPVAFTQLTRALGQNIQYDYNRMETAVVLSGWKYTLESGVGARYYNSYSYGNNASVESRPTIVVDLAPGVLDFSSSREEVVNNERRQQFSNKIYAFLNNEYNKNTQELLHKVIQNFSNHHLYQFFLSSVDVERIPVNVDAVANFNIRAGYNKVISIPVQSFANNNGFSVIDFLKSGNEKILLTSYSERGKLVNVNKGNSFSRMTKDEQIDFMKKSLASETPAVSSILYRSLTNAFMIKTRYRQFEEYTMPIRIFTEVNDDDLIKKVANLKYFAVNTMEQWKGSDIFVMMPGSLSQEKIDTIKDVFNAEVEVMTVSALDELVKEWKSDNKANNPNNARRVRSEDDAVEIIRFQFDDLRELNYYFHQKENKMLTVGEMLKNYTNPIFVFVARSAPTSFFKNVINDAADRNVDVVNRSIFWIKDKLTVSQYQMLKDKGATMMFHWDYPASNKISEELKADNTYGQTDPNRPFSKMALEAFTDEEKMNIILDSNYSRNNFDHKRVFKIAEFLEDDQVSAILENLSKVKKVSAERLSITTSVVQKSIQSVEHKKVLEALLSTIENFDIGPASGRDVLGLSYFELRYIRELFVGKEPASDNEFSKLMQQGAYGAIVKVFNNFLANPLVPEGSQSNVQNGF